MPSEEIPLVKDEDGKSASGTFSCSSVVGTILYLDDNTSPNIDYAMN